MRSGASRAGRSSWSAIAWAGCSPWRWRCGGRTTSPALACLATPWDFHADGQTQAQLIGAIGRAWIRCSRRWARCRSTCCRASSPRSIRLPSSPSSAASPIDPASDQARKFVALEDWLNDGVGAGGAGGARMPDAWYGENTTGARRVADRGRAGDGRRRCGCPRWRWCRAPIGSFHRKSALGLAQRLPRCETMTPAAGHIGMMVGGARARQGLGPARCLAPANCRKLRRQACA